MRKIVFFVLMLIGSGLPTFGADPPPKLSVEISASKNVKFATVAGVLSAIQKNQDLEADVVLRVQKAEGVSARIRVSPEIPYSDLRRLLQALETAGVGRITVVVR